MEVEKVRTERLLGNADLAKVYAKDVQRFVAAAAALHGLVRTFLARERHARELATESPEEIAAAKEAMSDEIKIFPARPTPPKSLSNVSAKDHPRVEPELDKLRAKYGPLFVDAYLDVLRDPESLDTRLEQTADGSYRLVLDGSDDFTVSRLRIGANVVYLFWLSWVRFTKGFDGRL